MAKKISGMDAPEWAEGLTPGTVEYKAREHFEREKTAYQERTGETVHYVPPTPVTVTPLAEAVTSDEGPVTSEEFSDAGGSEELTEDTAPEGDG